MKNLQDSTISKCDPGRSDCLSYIFIIHIVSDICVDLSHVLVEFYV